MLIISDTLLQSWKAKRLTKRSVFFALEIHSHWIFCPTIHGFVVKKNFDSLVCETSNPQIIMHKNFEHRCTLTGAVEVYKSEVLERQRLLPAVYLLILAIKPVFLILNCCCILYWSRGNFLLFSLAGCEYVNLGEGRLSSVKSYWPRIMKTNSCASCVVIFLELLLSADISVWSRPIIFKRIFWFF